MKATAVLMFAALFCAVAAVPVAAAVDMGDAAIAEMLREVFNKRTNGSAADAAPQTLQVYQTSYGFDDNTPPSATIDSHYRSVRGHSKAGGVGTYADPITFAAYDAAGFAPGAIIYVPRLRKYFIHEDSCGGCKNDWNRHKRLHVDLWTGADHHEDWGKLKACEDALTATAPLILHPVGNLPVDTTPLFDANTGRCHEGAGLATATHTSQALLADEAAAPEPAYAAPGSRFDLSDWTLQLPTYNSRHSVQIIDTQQLRSYASPYFYLEGGTDAMVLWAPEDGSHTQHSSYPRSELSGNTQWTVGGGRGGHHTMNATLRVEKKPDNGDIVVGQVHGLDIHSACSCVLEIGWKNGLVTAAMRDAGCNDRKVTLATGLAQGKTWSYWVDWSGTTLRVGVDGGSSTSLDYAWYSHPLHFKAGSYVQDSGSSSTTGGAVAFTQLSVRHS